MARILVGSIANLIFEMPSVQTIFLCLAALIALGLVWFVLWCVSAVRRGECPFPVGRKPKQATSDEGAKLSGWQQRTVPLAADDPDRKALLADLQGNILSGHGRDLAVHLFVTFTGDAGAARAWLKNTARSYVVTAAAQVAASKSFRFSGIDGGVFGHISLSAAGYGALGFKPSELPKSSNPRNRDGRSGYADVFAGGMKARQRYLLDPAVSAWESGYQEAVHVLVILACDNEAMLSAAVDKVVGSLEGVGKVVARETGMGLTRQLDPHDPSTVVHVEHFGYMDGRSQPVFLQEQVDAERKSGGIDVWNPAARLNLALVNDPLGDSSMSFGSFLVYRKLDQNVSAFNRAVNALAGELGVKPDLAGAMAMGRFKDGTPVVLQGVDGRTDVANNFDFSSDPTGLRCPFQAHIRKANPRGESVGEGDDTVEQVNAHRIVRRGIPYGGPLNVSDDPANQPTGGVGLLFFCYQGDIWEQFEVIQRRWCNNPFFLQPQKSKAPGYEDATGLDPIIGQSHPTAPNPARAPENWPKGWGEPTTTVETQLAKFVTMKGGEYFFSPSMSFLLGL